MRNLLDYLVLRLLKNKPMHGYGIILALRDLYGYYPGPSTIYPLLSAFERKKYVKSKLQVQNGKARKVYSITPEGEIILHFEEEIFNHILNMPRAYQ